MNRIQKQQRDAKVRIDYAVLLTGKGPRGTVINTLAALYNLTPRHIRSIVKESHDR